MKLFLSYLEYIPMRLIRKFVFNYKILLYVGKYIPYFKQNLNQINPSLIVKPYLDLLKEKGIQFENIRILEIGVGATNSTGYELADLTKSTVDVFEPFIGLDISSDAKLRESKKYSSTTIQKVTRIENSKDLRTYDLILSYSVLEHVSDNNELVKLLDSHLVKGGNMLHIVDYRDHFFKYPYHFLTFSDKIWNRFLNPGDLSRWRLGDHINSFTGAGFTCEIVRSELDSNKLALVNSRIKQSFKLIPFWDVLTASILVKK